MILLSYFVIQIKLLTFEIHVTRRDTITKGPGLEKCLVASMVQMATQE